ncbi:hypothetical protein [Mobilicoccus caccae]|uniref:SPW repeat-containing protein n=1 Tax=Mobilicoccus caccae TaxID=1859295 RepID=A0ABQ6ISB2_9MICO|nr:hypothetical protein [Mobilicoccus caccae]GMA40245.1 hypothetical protein GCM10025883_22900 [Mobilicoccus caccae]
MTQVNQPRAAAPGTVVLGLSLVVGLVAWAAFLSYRFGAAYSVWQVSGCAIIVLLGSILTCVLAQGRHAWATVVGVTAGLAVPWTWEAASTDETGLYLVGLILLLAGLLVSTIVITLVTDAVLRFVRRSRGPDHVERRAGEDST